jgi:hypothetical protein
MGLGELTRRHGIRTSYIPRVNATDTSDAFNESGRDIAV